MSSNPLQRSAAKSARKRNTLRFSILKSGDPKSQRLEHEMLVKRLLAFQNPLGIPRQKIPGLRNRRGAAALADPKFDNSWLSFNILAHFNSDLVGGLRVTRQMPGSLYPVRTWTNGAFEPLSPESWMYSRAYVYPLDFRRKEIHLFEVGLTVLCLAALGRSELEAMVAPGSVLIPKLQTGLGFRVSPRADGKPLACNVGPGDNPDLTPIELKISDAVLRRTWRTMRRINREKFAALNAELTFDSLLSAVIYQCGLDPQNLAPNAEEDLRDLEKPGRHVLNERQFFGRWNEPASCPAAG